MTDACQKIDEDNLPPLTPEVASGLAEKITGIIEGATKNSPGRPASRATKALVAKRVPTKLLGTYEVMDPYGSVIWDETMMILDRILAYPITTHYRKHLAGAPPLVRSAWQIHSQSLRVGELYIVQDRTSALLKFLRQVAIDCGLPTTDCERSFQSAFKRTFERRLRERHRLVHAHERPSLESRIIALGSAAAPAEPGLVRSALENVLDRVIPLLAAAREKAGRTVPRSMDDVVAIHEGASDREARQMLELVGEALLGTLNALPATPGAAPV